jgi:signal transduction histidine kinase
LRAIRNRLSRNRSSVNVDSVLEDLTVASELVRHSHDEARRTIAILRPEALEATGLVSALEQSARRIVARGSVTVEASYSGEARTLPLRVLDSLFRIGQEAFANAIQHGHPKKISIRMNYEPSSVTLIIQDDGAGFEFTPQLHGFGITGMRRRAEAIHATLEIESAPGKGARVSVTAATPSVSWWRRLAYSRSLKKEGRPNGS